MNTNGIKEAALLLEELERYYKTCENINGGDLFICISTETEKMKTSETFDACWDTIFKKDLQDYCNRNIESLNLKITELVKGDMEWD